jgi:UV DNA damage endonuclease
MSSISTAAALTVTSRRHLLICGLSEEEATEKAIVTWNREPVFHVSSPIEGWDGPKPERHHDFIDVKDFPKCWHDLDLTLEAKAKEVAVLKLKTELDRKRRQQKARNKA